MSDLFKQVVREHKLSTKLVPIFTVAPELELVCSRVADFVGDKFVGESRPLVAEMFADAIAAFKDAKADLRPHVAFAKGLFSRAHLLFAKRYVAWSGERYQVWSPLFEPIPLFEARYPKHRIEMADERCPENITQRSVAFQLAARTMSAEHFRLYFEDWHVADSIADCEVVPG